MTETQTRSSRTVWLASYPKSGNTWIRAMMAAVDHGYVELNSTMRGAAIAGARGPLEMLTGLVSSELLETEATLLRPLIDAEMDTRMPEQSTGFRHRKIHDALFTASGAPIIAPDAARAAIYVVRDPRDVAVSFAHHLGTDTATVVEYMSNPKSRMGGSKRRVTNQFGQNIGTWSSHVESWLDHDLFPVLLVRYEDLLADPVTQLGRITETLGREVTSEQLRAAAADARFENLKAQESASGFREAPHRERAFFRRGIAGAWREELAQDLVARIEADHERVMRRLGYLETHAPHHSSYRTEETTA